MIDITTKFIGAETVTRRFLDAPGAIRAKVKATVSELGAQLQTRVQADKLTGQYLKVRTGRLRRSISLRVAESGDSIMGSVGTNVAYARRFEVGGTWTETVRSHIRRNREQIAAATYKDKNGNVKVSSKGKRNGAISVRAFTRKVTVRARRFLRDSLDEMRPTIRGRLIAATMGGLHGA